MNNYEAKVKYMQGYFLESKIFEIEAHNITDASRKAEAKIAEEYTEEQYAEIVKIELI